MRSNKGVPLHHSMGEFVFVQCERQQESFFFHANEQGAAFQNLLYGHLSFKYFSPVINCFIVFNFVDNPFNFIEYFRFWVLFLILRFTFIMKWLMPSRAKYDEYFKVRFFLDYQDHLHCIDFFFRIVWFSAPNRGKV